MQLNCLQLQHIQNALACAVVAAPRSFNPDHLLKSLHLLKQQERTEYKVISSNNNNNSFISNIVDKPQLH